MKWYEGDLTSSMHVHRKVKLELPLSRVPIITSSPNLAFSHIESAGISPFLSSPRKPHEFVVCNWLIRFRETDTTSGCSENVLTRPYL
jgi:hypothetical protein